MQREEEKEGTCDQFMPVLFRTKMRMALSCGRPPISCNIKLLDILRAARSGNCSQMVPTSCKKRSISKREDSYRAIMTY